MIHANGSTKGINIPIGWLGLYFVYRYLPNYRTKDNPPLDLSGLLQFSSGSVLRSSRLNGNR